MESSDRAPVNVAARAPSPARDGAIKELTARGWATYMADGQLSAAAEHLLAHLEEAIGDDARTFLIDLGLITLLLSSEYQGSGWDPDDLAAEELRAAHDSFELDQERVVAEVLDGRSDAEVLEDLAILRAEQSTGADGH